MELLVSLAIFSSFFSANSFEWFVRNDAYCQNIYWQPHSLEEMHIAWCDISTVEKTIHKVKTGRFH